MRGTPPNAHAASGMVLLTLAAAQFLMTLTALFFSRRIPTKQPSAAPASEPEA